MVKFVITFAALITCSLLALWLSIKLTGIIGMRKAAENGISFKTPAAFLETAKIQMVVLDKETPFTKGNPVVTDVCSADHFTKSGYSVGGFSDDELLEVAALLEKNCEEGSARAIVKYADELLIDDESEISNFRAYPGNNLEAELEGLLIRGGTQSFVKEKVTIPPEICLRAEELAAQGKTITFFSKGKRLLGMIAVSDPIKEGTKEAVSELQNMGIRTVIVSEYDKLTAAAVSKSVGADVVISEISPERENDIKRKLSGIGKIIAYIDLINGNADFELEDKSLLNIPGAIRLSCAVTRNRKENIIWVSLCCVIGVLLITGAILNSSGISYILMVLGALMGLLSFMALVNAFRLKAFDIRRSVNGKYQRNAIEIATITAVSEEGRRD